jgi:hypothetical protein
MTEEEWLTCEDPVDLFRAFQVEKYLRKTRLFFVAHCREQIEWLDENDRDLVETSEQFAEESLPENERKVAFDRAAMDFYQLFADPEPTQSRSNPISPMESHVLPSLSEIGARLGEMRRKNAVRTSLLASLNEPGPFDYVCIPIDTTESDLPSLVSNIRCIFGNPFRPVTLNPAWLTSTVLALATGIYAERAFDRLPILGDALQDAGCENEDILNHCRSDGPHVKGCWVVDLLLCKS